MSNLSRSLVFTFLTAVGIAHATPTAGQPAKTKTQVAVHVSVEGTFVRYLESPNRDIDGVVLEDGTVARFAPLKPASRSALLQPGDPVHVEGDVVSGLSGPYLVHALVTKSDPLLSRGELMPPSTTGSAAGNSRSHPAKERGKAASKERPALPIRRLEIIESDVRQATTGKGKNGNYSQWSRTQETSGP